LDSCSTLIPTLNRLVARTILVHLCLNCQPPMHNGTLCPHSCSLLVFLKESMNSTPKRGTRLIGTVNGIFANIQPARAYNFVFLPIKIFCPLRSLCVATWLHFHMGLLTLGSNALCDRNVEVVLHTTIILIEKNVCQESISFHLNESTKK